MDTSDKDREIELHVGARVFKTRLSTLAKYPDAVLYKALTFSSGKPDFWDRNEDAFACLLEFYRTGRLVPSPGMSMDTLAQELKFWGFTLQSPPPLLLLSSPPTPTPASDACCIRPPLGASLRAMDRGCHVIVLCLVWSALTRVKALWEAAQVGLRDVCIYWRAQSKLTEFGINVSLLKNHAAFLQELAALDRCRLTFHAPVPVCDVHTHVRVHDVMTRGNLTFDSDKGTTVHAWKVSVIPKRHEQHIVFTALEPSKTTFYHKGFRVVVHVHGERLSWEVDCPDQKEFEELRPSSLPSTEGFLMEVKIVYKTYLMDAFFFPSSFSRCETLSGDLFYNQLYSVPEPRPSDWYVQSNRHLYVNDFYLDLGWQDDPESEYTPQEIVVLFEDRQDVTLSYSTNNGYMAGHESEYYERIEVSW